MFWAVLSPLKLDTQHLKEMSSAWAQYIFSVSIAIN